MAAGDLSQFGARRGIAEWIPYIVTATGTPAGLNGPCVVGAVVCIVAGTVNGIYNASGAVSGATNLVPALAMTALQRVKFGGGRGVRFNAGVYLDITSGTYMVLAMPGV